MKRLAVLYSKEWKYKSRQRKRGRHRWASFVWASKVVHTAAKCGQSIKRAALFAFTLLPNRR